MKQKGDVLRPRITATGISDRDKLRCISFPFERDGGVMDEGTVCFAHGGETGPWCGEILRLAEVATSKGFLTRSPDFCDLPDANARIERLISLPYLSQSRVVLVGLDIGAYVTAIASVTLKPAGLFLLAPAFSLQGYGLQRKTPEAGKIIVVHGWDDEKVDYLNAIRFARDSGADLYLLQSDHKLTGQIGKIEMLFSIFLDSILTTRTLMPHLC